MPSLVTPEYSYYKITRKNNDLVESNHIKDVVLFTSIHDSFTQQASTVVRQTVLNDFIQNLCSEAAVTSLLTRKLIMFPIPEFHGRARGSGS